MEAKNNPQQIVPWIIWFSFLSGVFMIYSFLGTHKMPPEEIDLLNVLIVFVPFTLSMVIRWVVLPRSTSYHQAFPMMIVGMALAEATLFIGIFFVSDLEVIAFILSIIGIATFIPFYMKKFFSQSP